MLKPDELGGYLVSVPIPWDDSEKLLADLFCNVTHELLDKGCDGIYLFGTSGEGYAITEKEFCQIVDIFARETADANVFRQIGCFGLSSDQVKERCAVVNGKGIEGVQITLPFWKELTDTETVRYFKDVCGSFPNLSFMLYNNPRNKRKLTGKELAKIHRQVPNLHGAKTGSGNWRDFVELLTESPMIRHFVTETAFLFCYPFGAAGLIPSSNYARPMISRRYYDSVINGGFDDATILHRDIMKFFYKTASPLSEKGYIDGAIDKAYARIGGMDMPLYMKSPYVALSIEDFKWLKNVIQNEFPDEEIIAAQKASDDFGKY